MNLPGILVVGEANPFGGDPKFALYHLPRTSSGNRLRNIMGLTDLQYACLCKVNLCPRKWSAKAARLTAVALYRGSRDTVLVLLGSKVRSVFPDAPPLFALRYANYGLVLVSIPHPSGACRLWNVPGARDKAVELLRMAAPHVPWGTTFTKPDVTGEAP